MTAQLNHTLVAAHDKKESATFLAEILGLSAPEPFGPFLCVTAGNGVSLDFMDVDDPAIHAQHYAFLVSEEEFDEIFERINGRGLSYWADPHQQRPSEINHHDGGRGVYWSDPGGHLLEIITCPYGSGG